MARGDVVQCFCFSRKDSQKISLEGRKIVNKDVLKAIIALKQEEIPFEAIPRDIKLPVKRKDIITIPGVRRCGKSTVMELAVNELVASGVSRERILWVGFDDERLARMKVEELDNILSAYMEMYPDIPLKDVYMFFDELPLVKGWELFVLRVFKSYCKHIFVCGSNAHVLSREMKSELRGWPYEVELWPLTLREFCRFRGGDADSPLESERARLRVALDEYLRFGAMPGVVLETSISDKFRKLQGYFDTMLLRDFIEHWSVSNPPVLRYFLKRVMAGLSSPVSVNAIYNDIKSQGFRVTKNDLYDWLDKACGIYLFVRAPKYNKSVAKEQQSLSKYYVVDNGLRTAMLIAQSDDEGKHLENSVFLHLYRNRGGEGKICYWQGRGECDFVICRDNEVERRVQVTWDLSSDAVRRREISGLLEAATALECTDLTIVTHDEEDEIIEDGRAIHVIPAWKYLVNPPSDEVFSRKAILSE